MSEITMTACVGCGAAAPADHHTGWPAAGWLSVRHGGCYDDGDGNPQTFPNIDACSWACLASIVARNIAEGADDLETYGR